MTRRTALALLGSASLAAQPPRPRSRPLICVLSRDMAKLPYFEVGPMAQQLGFDGVDLTVMPGGHVEPRNYPVDLGRAFDSIRTAGLEVPMITTGFTSASDPYALAVLTISAREGVQFARLGNALPRELPQFAALARYSKLTVLVDYVDSTVEASVDPNLVGQCFDPLRGAPEKWESSLLAALPRMKAVSISDADGKAGPCPLGEGVIDWKKFFAILAGVHFAGPLSLRIDYQPKNDVVALTKDLEFLRRHVEEAWKA